MIKNKTAYSILTIKSFDDITDGERVITGIATTPAVDRVGDEVDPMGAIFKTPMPLLLHHDHRLPVGTVEFAQATKEGIPFVARIAKVDEAGVLKDRVDEAWQSVKAGLIKAVSIGFNALEYLEIKTGLRFTKWEWYELSLVTVPANVEATITAIKTLDDKYRAISGDTKKETQVGDSTHNKTQPTNIITKEQKMKKYAEQIAALKAKLDANIKRMDELYAKSNEEGFTLSAEDKQESENIKLQNTEIEDQISGLEYLQAKSLETAVEVKGKTEAQAKAARVQIPVKSKSGKAAQETEKGLQFARVAKCISLARGDSFGATQNAENLYGDNEEVLTAVKFMTSKAAVNYASNSSDAYAGYLVTDGVIQDFLDYAAPLSIIGQLNLREVPFGEEWVESLGGGQAYWVGEGGRKLPTSFSLRHDTLSKFKVAALAVLSMENIQDSDGKSDVWVRNELVRVLNEALDLAFIDPANSGTPNVKPASVTNGVTPLASAGDVEADVNAAIRAYVKNNKTFKGGVMVVDTETAISLVDAVHTVSGAPLYQGVSISDDGYFVGRVKGMRVIISDHMSQFADTAGRILVVLNEQKIVKGYAKGAPGLIVKWSDQASVVMNNDPASTQAPVSLWQNNLVGCLVEQRIDWKKQSINEAVVIVEGITW